MNVTAASRIKKQKVCVTFDASVTMASRLTSTVLKAAAAIVHKVSLISN